MTVCRLSDQAQSVGQNHTCARRRWTIASAVLACCGLGSTTVFAQLAGGGLTDNGLGGGTVSLRDQVTSLLAPPSVNVGLPWTFSGDVDVEAGATDSPGGTGGGWQPVILLSPDLNLNGVTSRLNVALSYSPRLAWYPSTENQTLLSNTFNGNATATLVPDLLFLNVRGITGVTSRFGNTAISNSFLSQSEAVQTSSFSISPYIMRTFGGIGTLTAGYTYARTFQDGNNNFSPQFFAPNSANTAGFGTTGDLATQTEYATFTTGENLGRTQDSASITATQNGGSYYYDGSTTLQVSDTISYAVYRWLTLLATGGYEEYNYPRSMYQLNEPTWAFGATFTPNADSSLTIEYGQTAGTDTILANGTYSPTARTRIYGSYNVNIETGLGARQNLLGTTTVGPGGILLDRTNGSPVLANNYLASQYPLSRVKTLTVGGALLLDRDTITVSGNRTEFSQLGNSTDVLGVTTTTGTSTDSIFGTVGWQHDLSPSTSLYTTISYGVSNNGVYYGQAGGSQSTVQVYSGLTHTFTDTLSGSVSYSHSERFGNAVQNLPAAFGGAASQNTLLVGLRKSF